MLFFFDCSVYFCLFFYTYLFLLVYDEGKFCKEMRTNEQINAD